MVCSSLLTLVYLSSSPPHLTIPPHFDLRFSRLEISRSRSVLLATVPVLSIFDPSLTLFPLSLSFSRHFPFLPLYVATLDRFLLSSERGRTRKCNMFGFVKTAKCAVCAVRVVAARFYKRTLNARNKSTGTYRIDKGGQLNGLRREPR